MISHQFTGLALALSVTLAACGGGGETGAAPSDSTSSAPTSAPAASAPEPTAPPHQVVKSQCRDVKVILFGDSTMQGSQKYTLDANGRSALGRWLDAHSTRHVALDDQSAPGTTSTQMIAGWDGVKQGPAWPYKPDADVIVVNHGINDAARTLPAVYDLNLRIIASAGVPVVFETPNPVPDMQQDTTGYAAIMRTVAFETNQTLADTFAYVMALPNWQSRIYDGAHPDYLLYLALASDVVGPALLPLVEAVPCK